MKKSFIPFLLIAFFITTGCTEEKNFSFEAQYFGNVNFTVKNLTVGEPDEARSSALNDYEYDNREFVIEYQYSGDRYYDHDYYEHRYVSLGPSYQLWSGGNNQLQFTFQPSSPEEKSAKFTMPDGTIYEATAENPSFTWTVTRDALANVNGEPNNDWDIIVKAESEYHEGNSNHTNRGYVSIQLDTDLVYTSTGKWYWSEWTNGEPVRICGNVNFSAKNLLVNEPDTAVSVAYNGYYQTEGYDYRSFQLGIYRMSSDSIPQLYYPNELFSLDGVNELWVGGNNEIEVTYRPAPNDSESVQLLFPDGKSAVVTATNPTATWTLDKDSFQGMTNYPHVIEAYDFHTDGEFIYDNHGYIYLDVSTNIFYDPKYSLWFYGYWGKL